MGDYGWGLSPKFGPGYYKKRNPVGFIDSPVLGGQPRRTGSMRSLNRSFGFYPAPLRIEAGPMSVVPLPSLDKSVDTVLGEESVEDGWFYAPPQQKFELVSRQIRQMPYSSRVFGLPRTHTIEHACATGQEHLGFLLWTLSFFTGMRLTAWEVGFLDATPVHTRKKLVDFVVKDRGLARALELGDSFWRKYRDKPRCAQRFAAAVHALFVGQYPQALQYERFIHLFAAIDSCYRLTSDLRGGKQDKPRIEWMCGELGVKAPEWASRVASIRNDALHEALFGGEPLGFAVDRSRPRRGIELPIDFEMKNLVCRLLVALIGGDDPSYFSSPVRSRQNHGLSLS